jgi:dTDP-4-amino-4,6-dideoxygalactose transaminase
LPNPKSRTPQPTFPVPQVDLWPQHRECQADIRAAVEAVVGESAFISGRFVREFEEAFAEYCEVRQCVGVANGTDALALALRAVGVGPGDAVVTVPFTFAATVEAICQVGARPVFVDIEPKTYTMDVEALGALLRREPRVKAIMPVHLFGHPAAMGEIAVLAQRCGAYVIEDACQAHGARWQGKRVGGWGHLNCFSFYPTKNLGAMGDGGALTTDDVELARKVRLLADHGQGRKYEHACLGWNSRLDGLQAAVLAVKLKRLDDWNARRRHWARTYCRRLQATSLQLPFERAEAVHVYHLFVVRSPRRDNLCEFLGARGIAVGLHYPLPLHFQPAFAALGYRAGDFPVAEASARECLSLPLFPHLGDEQVEWVCDSVWDWENHKP